MDKIAFELIQCMVQNNPENRPTALEVLNSYFFWSRIWYEYAITSSSCHRDSPCSVVGIVKGCIAAIDDDAIENFDAVICRYNLFNLLNGILYLYKTGSNNGAS